MIWIYVSIFLIPFVIGYFAGSIPFGLIFSKLGGAGDVRSIGSGNIGATNVLRTGRKGLAALTLLFDMLKGLLPTAFFLQMEPQSAMAAGLGAFLGHLFPIWLKFKGGKGVAVFIGVLVAFSWKIALIFAGVWLLVAAVARYSSLAALCATVATTAAFFFQNPRQDSAIILFSILTLLTWFMHRENIARLMKRTEGKIGEKSKTATPDAPGPDAQGNTK